MSESHKKQGHRIPALDCEMGHFPQLGSSYLSKNGSHLYENFTSMHLWTVTFPLKGDEYINVVNYTRC